MKKRIALIVTGLLLVCTFALAGCNAGFSKIAVEGKQDYTYSVTSNGGNAVQYGNYVYFINGTRGYADEAGADNVWGKVTKGGLYRAELNGTRVGDEFIPSSTGTGLEFMSKKGEDYDGNEVDVVSVQLIAPKTIGTSGYANGGIFIYDEWVYYASPNNEKDKTGTVQINKTDFFRTKLDGSATQKIYTTTADSATSPYSFQKWNGSVYLLTYFDSKVVSVKMTGNKKPEAPVEIAKNVTGAILPFKSNYNAKDTSVKMEDYIYILRAATSDDDIKTGNMIEVYSPDGKEGAMVVNLGQTETALEAVRDGMLFYRSLNNSKITAVNATNMHGALMDMPESNSSYKTYQDSLRAEDFNKITNTIKFEVFASSTMSNFTSTYSFRPGGIHSNVAYTIGISASSVALRSSNRAEDKTILNEAIKLSFVDGDYIYFTAGESTILYRTEWNKSIDDKTSENTKMQITAEITANGLPADICAGYIVYMADVDEWAKGYAKFQKSPEYVVGKEPIFIGEKIEADLKPKEEDEEEKKEDKGCGSIMSVKGFGTTAAVLVVSSGAIVLGFVVLKRKKQN